MLITDIKITSTEHDDDYNLFYIYIAFYFIIIILFCTPLRPSNTILYLLNNVQLLI